ncbi:MAG: hypothetical protein JST79_21535 [Acidobacteria bacterium]|nr:hypothetical protein [Acidobacteriota bacterium]
MLPSCLRHVVLGLWLVGSALAQTAVPIVSFNFDFPGSEPEHYVITVAHDGQAAYESSGKLNPDNSEVSRLEFTISEPARKKIFDLAKQAGYFQKELDANKKVAFTGNKVLAYQDGARNTQAKYNYSSIPAVQELTQLFQSMSATLEFGRRLRYFHRYQKLALNDELKRMEQSSHDNMLQEMQAVAPVLQEIAKDPTVMNIDRARALRLLEQAQAPARAR